MADRETAARSEAVHATRLTLRCRTFELVADRGGPHVHPNDSVVHRDARALVPHHCRFALIRDAHRRNLRGVAALAAFRNAVPHAGKNNQRIMLHPAGLRHNLLKLLLVRCDGIARPVEKDCTRRRRSLIDR